MDTILLLVGGSGPQFALSWVFWIAFILWIIFGFSWYWPRPGIAPGPWHGPGTHGMIALFLFLLGWGLWGLPGISG